MKTPGALHDPFGQGPDRPSVYVLNVIDGCIPSDMATGSMEEIKEERRLLYVAMTRAKDDLHLLVPQRFYTHHQPGTATVTSTPPEAGSSRLHCCISSRA